MLCKGERADVRVIWLLCKEVLVVVHRLLDKPLCISRTGAQTLGDMCKELNVRVQLIAKLMREC